MQVIGKFHAKISVISNGLEIHMAFITRKLLLFDDSVQFMNSSLEALLKNLSDNDFKNLSHGFIGGFIRLVKQKGEYPYEYMDNFKKFFDDKLPDRCEFLSSVKDDSISKKDYLHVIDVWTVSEMNAMGDYHDLHLKTKVYY